MLEDRTKAGIIGDFHGNFGMEVYLHVEGNFRMEREG
jgi:hypothetical protein